MLSLDMLRVILSSIKDCPAFLDCLHAFGSKTENTDEIFNIFSHQTIGGVLSYGRSRKLGTISTGARLGWRHMLWH